MLLLALVLAVYRPVLPGSFLMDDWRLIATDNPLVNGQLTPASLWFQTDFTLSTLALWLQHLAWGHQPAWYHLVNVLLHAASAMLLWRLLVKLKIPGAWFAAALYAVHPVCVNSVARIAEIKNTLSLPFFLFSLTAYLRYESLALFPAGNDAETTEPRRRATLWLTLSLLAFIAALLSKTSTVMLPVLLLACAAWQRGRLERRDWLHTAPFFVLSLAFGLMSIWFQKHQALFNAGETLAPSAFGERLAVAGHVFWFYLGKALCPLNLNLVYPQWKPGPSGFLAFLPHLALLGALAAGWHYRRTWGRHVLLGAACFGIALFPALGLFDSQFLAHWQVSDHLQYLPLIAPVALAAAALAALRNRVVFSIVAAALLTTLSVLTFQRSAVFASEESLMRDTLAKNPAAASAHNDLGTTLARRNDLAGAIAQFQLAVSLQPDNAAAHENLGQALAVTGNFPAAEAEYQAALQHRPFAAGAHKKLAELLLREGRKREAMFHYQVALAFSPDNSTRLALASIGYQTGDAPLAIAMFSQVLAKEPENLDVLNNLAWLLATWDDDRIRDGAKAVRLAEKACKLTGYKQPRMTGTLAAAFAEAGRYSEAVATGDLTVKLANDAGNQSLTYVGNQLLLLYREKKPYRETLAATIE